MKQTRQAWMEFPCRAMLLAFGLMLAIHSPAYAADHPATGPATRPAENPQADISASIKTWFGDLASSDAAVRAEALTSLMGISADDLPILKAVVEQSRPLVPAQSSVLRQIVTQDFLSGETYEAHGDTGFLGVRMEQTRVSFRETVIGANETVPAVGVIIVERMPGFAGARMLRDGDVILSVLNRPDTPISDPEGFALAVKSVGGGKVAHFLLLRDGQVVHIDVKLDPRPVEADQGFAITDLLERRRVRAEEYWTANFAALVKEGVS